jgi:hypothetical protein
MFSLFDPFLHCHTTMFGAHIWVSVWLLFDAKWAIMSKTSSILMRWWRFPLCTRPMRFIGFYNARLLKQQCTLTHYSDYKPTSLCPSTRFLCRPTALYMFLEPLDVRAQCIRITADLLLQLWVGTFLRFVAIGFYFLS